MEKPAGFLPAFFMNPSFMTRICNPCLCGFLTLYLICTKVILPQRLQDTKNQNEFWHGLQIRAIERILARITNPRY